MAPQLIGIAQNGLGSGAASMIMRSIMRIL